MADPTENPSQIHGHATYVAGAAKEALGFESGAADKEYAVKEMRAAREQSEASGTLRVLHNTVWVTGRSCYDWRIKSSNGTRIMEYKMERQGTSDCRQLTA